MPYAKIDGKWTQVNSYTASQLSKSGYSISYSKSNPGVQGPLTRPVNTLPGNEFVSTQQRQGPPTYQQRINQLDSGAGSAFGAIGGVGFGLPSSGTDLAAPQAEINADVMQGLPDNTPEVYQYDALRDFADSALLSVIDAARLAQIKDYISSSFNENPEMWFAYGEGNQGAGYYPKRTGILDIEQMQGQGGSGIMSNMSDGLVGAVTQWYKDLYITGPVPEGIDNSDLRLGGGGGGGFGGQFVSSDRRTVEDAVKAQLFALTGETTPERVTELTDAWLAAEKASWEVRIAGGEQVNPNQTTLDMIRSQGDYKQIHKLRGEGDDEMQWIASRKQALSQRGIDSQSADERAVQLAQLGTNIAEIDTGAYQAGRGRQDIGMLRSISSAARQVAEAL